MTVSLLTVTFAVDLKLMICSCVEFYHLRDNTQRQGRFNTILILFAQLTSVILF